ncbi:MAG: hypothetical protein COV72_01950 [Candidatus Omnitrophica bacterium CG11_big_fil_rev_8_21_14_0_20_42_13]|uniref:Uncharacterized protein n=1 Tax=Candidatus Ghiorseimicrobium undicola TaxID=1974746 RepID=A0A2H0LYZ8_9BACT|nr:MAG: hypothetical protein COV72_01950 [Candidatus Omnitrophica bacterium CG11_big_fil_rev_8_21_14_0_20_42_13]
MAGSDKKEARKFLPKDNRGYSNKVTAVLKLIIVLLILPVLVAHTRGLLNTLSTLESRLVVSFWFGVFVFFLIDLIIFKLNGLYKGGQKIIEAVFRFFAPLFKFAPYVLPIYTIIILVFSLAMDFFGGISSNQNMLMNLCAFSTVLHLVYTADAFRSRQSDFLKAGHFFTISLIYLCNLFVLAFAIDRILPNSSFFASFFHNSSDFSRDIYTAIFNQLFSI